MKPAAYLVDLPHGAVNTHAVFLDCERSIDYAARNHGSVTTLVRKSEADRLQVRLDALLAAIKEVYETELGELGSTGSVAPCEHALGLLFDAAGLPER